MFLFFKSVNERSQTSSQWGVWVRGRNKFSFNPGALLVWHVHECSLSSEQSIQENEAKRVWVNCLGTFNWSSLALNIELPDSKATSCPLHPTSSSTSSFWIIPCFGQNLGTALHMSHVLEEVVDVSASFEFLHVWTSSFPSEFSTQTSAQATSKSSLKLFVEAVKCPPFSHTGLWLEPHHHITKGKLKTSTVCSKVLPGICLKRAPPWQCPLRAMGVGLPAHGIQAVQEKGRGHRFEVYIKLWTRGGRDQFTFLTSHLSKLK